ncbi:MAG: AbrB family transcriptional regulator, partial [Cyanobacteriota bacterium]
MLTGADLLAKVKELGDVSKSDLVRSCGYVSTKKDGTERLNFTAFYEALLEAKG